MYAILGSQRKDLFSTHEYFEVDTCPKLANNRFRDEYYRPFPPDFFAPKPGNQRFEVAIIGAGIAGLTAAIALLQSGHNVEVSNNEVPRSNNSDHEIVALREIQVRQRDWRSNKCWPQRRSHTLLLRIQFRPSLVNADARGTGQRDRSKDVKQAALTKTHS